MTDVQTHANPNHKWYIVHAYSNFEKKVAESIREQAKTQGLDENFSDILVPTEDVVEIRRGRKVNAERKFFPGYVLVKMELTDEAYHLIKNTPKVTGFLGSGSKPMPVSEREVARIIGAIEEGVERPKPTITFETGSSGRLNLPRVVWSPQAMFTMTWRGSPWRLTGEDRLIGRLAPGSWSVGASCHITGCKLAATAVGHARQDDEGGLGSRSRCRARRRGGFTCRGCGSRRCRRAMCLWISRRRWTRSLS